MNFDSLSDEEIIEKYKGGSEYAVEFILSKYKNVVNSLANKYFLIGAEQEDLLQEGMIGLYKACYGFKQSAGNSFKNFAYLCIERQIQSAVKAANRKKNIALNSALSLNSQFALKSEKLDDDEQSPNIDSGEPSPEDRLIEEETYVERMRQIKQILSVYEYTILKHYLKGYKYEYIAELIDRDFKSIDNALMRIKTKLKDLKNSKD